MILCIIKQRQNVLRLRIMTSWLDVIISHTHASYHTETTHPAFLSTGTGGHPEILINESLRGGALQHWSEVEQLVGKM